MVSRGSKNSDRPSSTRSLVIGDSALAMSLGSGWKISCACFSSAASCAAAAVSRIVKLAVMPAAPERAYLAIRDPRTG